MTISPTTPRPTLRLAQYGPVDGVGGGGEAIIGGTIPAGHGHTEQPPTRGELVRTGWDGLHLAMIGAVVLLLGVGLVRLAMLKRRAVR